MPPEDHLDKETSISAEVTPTGIKASAKSRTVAAIDRLVGNVFDKWSAPMEAKTAEVRAISASRLRLIDHFTELGIDELRQNPELRARALENHYGRVFERQTNKEAVVVAAVEDLRMQPPTDEEAHSGEEALGDPFLLRFERYAEDASSEHVRLKWARVLASEIRRPGTFSTKVLRVVDELDSDTASLFERVCAGYIDGVIPDVLFGEPSFDHLANLTSADLLLEQGLGHHREAAQTVDNANREIWFFGFGLEGFALLPQCVSGLPNVLEAKGRLATEIQSSGARIPVLPVHIPTAVGVAINTILPNRQTVAFERLFQAAAQQVGTENIRRYRRNSLNNWSFVG